MIVPTHIAAGVAGLPLAQANGSEVERADQEVNARQRRVHFQRKAETAEGVGQPDGEEHQPDDRDADGRYPWDVASESKRKPSTPASRPSKDPSGQSGGMLDVTG
jgi:hypothetical protein